MPVLIHELGHIVCLRLLGLRICGFKAELRGLCMGYAGCTSGFGRILAAAAGPAAGGLYALIASYAGKIYGSDWLLCSAGVSVILTASTCCRRSRSTAGRYSRSLPPRLSADDAVCVSRS